MNAYRPRTPPERTAYRRYIKEHHPDVGGDPAAFAIGLAQLRATFSGDPAPRPADRYDAPVVFVSGADRMQRRVRWIWQRMRRRPEPPRAL